MRGRLPKYLRICSCKLLTIVSVQLRVAFWYSGLRTICNLGFATRVSWPHSDLSLREEWDIRSIDNFRNRGMYIECFANTPKGFFLERQISYFSRSGVQVTGVDGRPSSGRG